MTTAAVGGDYTDWPVYGLAATEKAQRLLERLTFLVAHHRERCIEYDRILRAHGSDHIESLADVPFLPVRLFKTLTLRSVAQTDVVKVLTSSGTTGQAVSRIYLDRHTASAQTKALVRIIQSFIGSKRIPMLIIDHPGVIKDRSSFSARGAGILGLSNFGRDHTYALRDESMALDLALVEAFSERHRDEPLFVFGFTFMVWRYFVRRLEEAGRTLPLGNATLIHSGGWKKLQDEAVGNDAFKRRVAAVCGAKSHNFYGMVEQVGSVFMECEHGHLHAPSYADVLIRDPRTFRVCGHGESGLIQVISAIPESYPGHSLLTEDLGVVHGVDDCPCLRKGVYFSVLGRVPRAEVRGCSDTHAQSVSA